MTEVLLILLAYFIGSIPTAVWISRYFFDVDIREYGSGNAGATNTYRVLGSKWGTIVMIVDVLKGLIATSLYIFIPYYLHSDADLDRTNLMLGLGLAAVAGHIFPIWADFRGGKGVATLFGMILSIQPLVAVSLVAVFVLMLFLTRYVSLSSIVGGFTYLIGVTFFYNRYTNNLVVIFGMCICLLILVTHQKNIERLLKGRESKVNLFKRKETTDQA